MKNILILFLFISIMGFMVGYFGLINVIAVVFLAWLLDKIIPKKEVK